MHIFNSIGWLILAAVLMALPTLARAVPAENQVFQRVGSVFRAIQRWSPAGLVGREAGVVAITYISQGQTLNWGTTTAPTAVQASQLPVQVAQVFFADTDTAAVIVHNWNLPASFANFGYPLIFYTKQLGGASEPSFATDFTFGITNTNSVTMQKTSVGTGSGGTWLVTMFKPSGPWLNA